MKKLITYLTLFILIFSAPSFAKNWIMPAYDGTTGGTAGKLDAIDVCSADGAGYDVQDKDAALVWDQAAGTFSIYIYDIDSAAAESDPSVIAPDFCDTVAYTGNGRWLLSYPAMTATGADAIAATITTPGGAFDTLADFTDDIDATLRFCQGQTFQTFGAEDTTPDVSNGGSTVVQCWRTAGTPTIIAFDDGDDTSEFADGDTVFLLFDSAAIFTINGSASFKGHGNNDYTGAAGEWGWFTWDGANNYWVVKFSETKSANFTTLRMPNHESTDAVLSNLGEVYAKATDDAIAVHMGTAGEIAGETLISAIQVLRMTFDPKVVCDGAVDRLFLMTVGDEAPNGIIIDEWKVSFEADPTTEWGAGHTLLKRADAFIGVANAATIDDLATTAGVSTEDTDANINAGAAVANGKVIYIEFATAYTEANHQVIFEMWYHPEED